MPSASTKPNSDLDLARHGKHWLARFGAMACPCEVLIRTDSAGDARALASLAKTEALRIEHQFSRYRTDNIIYRINHSHGRTVEVDRETSQLLHYAASCHALSGGLFDVTSGILRRAWNFDGREAEPDEALIAALLPLVGWHRVEMDDRRLTMQPGMEIDLGGLGKEYAVDRVARLLVETSDLSVMINFGGDIVAVGPGDPSQPWCIGIADPEHPECSLGTVELVEGAVTTSGVTYRHCYVNGKRLSHILDPRTGWPVADAPRSVTVVGDYCLEAGLLTTMAMLQGPAAESFLAVQGVKFHCIW